MKLNTDRQTQAVTDGATNLADDARALLTATADVAGEQVNEARKRLAAALESGKEMYGRVRESAVEGAKATDKAVKENPYKAIGIAAGVGLVLGFFIGRSYANRE